MAHSAPIDGYDILWVTLDPDTKECFPRRVPKKLKNICAEKLVTDVLLVERYCLKLPKSVHLLIFSTAVKKKRTLSVEQLMKYCPCKVLEMPVPDILKSLHIVPQIKNSITEHEITDLTRISITMLSVFFDLIKKNNSNSALQILDFGLFPLRSAALVKIREFLFKERAKVSLFTKTYTLKCTVAVENVTDLRILRACAVKSTSLGFDLNITGIIFYNDHFSDVEVLRFLDSLKNPDLQLITLSFASLSPNYCFFFIMLKSFKFLKYLNFSYSTDLLSSFIDRGQFFSHLAQLTKLQRLVLKGIHLNGRLSKLLLKYCKEYCHGTYSSDCCFLHSGSLCYLDVSSCNLSDDDLEFLKELSVANSLKYLDISENSLNEKKTFENLLCLKCSLQVLNISSCFKHLTDYDNAVMPFSAFTQLKYLNIKGLRLKESSKHLLEHELQKMPNLEIIETSIPVSLTGVTVC